MKLTRRQLRRLIRESTSQEQHVDPDEFAKEFFMKESVYKLGYLRSIVRRLKKFIMSAIEFSEVWYRDIDKGLLIGPMFGREFQKEFLLPAKEYAVSLYWNLSTIENIIFQINDAFNQVVQKQDKSTWSWLDYGVGLAYGDARIDYASFNDQYHTSDVTLENPITYIINTIKEAKYNILNIEPSTEADLKFKDSINTNLERFGIDKPLDLIETIKVTTELFTLNTKDESYTLEDFILDRIAHFDRETQKLSDLEGDYLNYIEDLVVLIKDEFPEEFIKSFPPTSHSY